MTLKEAIEKARHHAYAMCFDHDPDTVKALAECVEAAEVLVDFKEQCERRGWTNILMVLNELLSEAGLVKSQEESVGVEIRENKQTDKPGLGEMEYES